MLVSLVLITLFSAFLRVICCTDQHNSGDMPGILPCAAKAGALAMTWHAESPKLVCHGVCLCWNPRLLWIAQVESLGEGDPGGAASVSRLHMVDLAGSERQARTGAAGQRLREAGGRLRPPSVCILLSRPVPYP